MHPHSQITRRRLGPLIEPLEARVAPATLSFAQNYASGYNTSVPVAHDSAGNVYVAGVFDGQIDLDPSALSTLLLETTEGAPGNRTGSDLYIAKYDSAGTLIWARSWGGAPGAGGPVLQENPRDLVVDAAGDVYVLAEFDTVSAGFGGSGPTNTSGTSGFDTVVLKLDGSTGNPATSFGSAGVLQWGGSGNERAGRLGLDGGGSLYFTGSYDSPNARLNGAGLFATPTGDEVYVLKVSATSGAAVTQFGSAGLLHFGSPGSDSGGRPLPSGTSLFIESYEGKNGNVRKVDSSFGSPILAFGGGGRIDIPNLGGVALDHNGNLLATGGIQSPGGYLKRFSGASGIPDATFDLDGTVDLGTAAQFGQSIVVDANDNIYVGGTVKANPATAGKYFLIRVNDAGAFDASFGASGRLYFATTGRDMHRDIRLSVDSSGYLVARGFFSGTTDIDPTTGTLSVAAATPGINAGHLDLDTFTARIDPAGVNSTNPFTFVDASGDVVRIAVAGTGSLRVTPGTTPGVDIEKIETVATDATTNLRIALKAGSVGTLTIASIITPGGAQDLGSLTLGKNVLLGDGIAGGDPALKITGKSTKISLTDVNAFSEIDLGEGLAYLDTYTNAPNITIRNILGDGVTIDVTGDGTEAGVGGGGLGRILVNNWMGAGLIKTTQSVKSYRQKFGDCYVVFELDKDELGAATKADIGSMSIPNGSWGSSGNVIEGNVGTFSAANFLAGATLTAGSLNALTVKSGPYAGTVTLKDPSAPAMKTFKVNGDFVGYVDTVSSIKNIRVVGEFKGSLLAASIGSITAFSFDGTTTDDLYKDPLRHEIIATSGSLGSIKTTGGGMKNFEIDVFTTFGGFKMSTGTGANEDTTGIENVRVLAAAIGTIGVTFKPAIGAPAITLLGIKDSIFESETTIGAITSTHAISGSLFAAATEIGNISVGTALFPAESIATSTFLGGVNLGGDGAVDGDETFIRAGKIGNVTVKGALTTTTFAAGINPVDGIFGNGDDVAAAGAILPGVQKAIGKFTIGAGSGTLTAGAALTHSYVIEGRNLGGFKINNLAALITGLPKYLKIGGVEATTDILVRTI